MDAIEVPDAIEPVSDEELPEFALTIDLPPLDD
jgi:hypothetical protein